MGITDRILLLRRLPLPLNGKRFGFRQLSLYSLILTFLIFINFNTKPEYQ